MTTATLAGEPAAPAKRSLLTRAALRRGLIGGTTWGVTVGLALSLTGTATSGVICLTDVAASVALATVAGIATIGPLTLLNRRPG